MQQIQESADLIYDPDGNVVAVARIADGLKAEDKLEMDAEGKLVLTRPDGPRTLCVLPQAVLAMTRSKGVLLFRDLNGMVDRALPVA